MNTRAESMSAPHFYMRCKIMGIPFSSNGSWPSKTWRVLTSDHSSNRFLNDCHFYWPPKKNPSILAMYAWSWHECQNCHNLLVVQDFMSMIVLNDYRVGQNQWDFHHRALRRKHLSLRNMHGKKTKQAHKISTQDSACEKRVQGMAPWYF